MKKILFSHPIGIVGGAGPKASAFLYTTLIEMCQKQFGSNDYDEFPEIIIDSFPFTRGHPEKIRRDISACLTKLEDAGALIFCIACHSFHGFLPDTSSMHFVNLIVESLAEAKRQNISRAIILAAQTTIDLKLYERSGLQCMYPSKEDQTQVLKIIREVASGRVTQHQAGTLKEMIEHMVKSSPIDGIILACTELPLIHRQFSVYDALPVIDTIEVLAKKLLALSQGKSP